MDGLPAEVPHVGVERLTAGDAQHDGPEDHEAVHLVVDEELDRVDRVQRAEDLGDPGDPDHAQHRERAEPHHHHRPEDATDRGGAALLDGEQPDEDGDGDRDDDRVAAARVDAAVGQVWREPRERVGRDLGAPRPRRAR